MSKRTGCEVQQRFQSNDESEVLVLDEPAFALAGLVFALCASFFLVGDQDQGVREGTHWTLLALDQPYVTADLDKDAHVCDLLLLACSLIQRGECWVEDVCVDGLDFEVGEGHLCQVEVREFFRVGDDGAIVGNLRQQFPGRKDGLGDVVGGQSTTGACQGDIVCVGDGLGSCDRVRAGARCRIRTVVAYRAPRRE